jgi:4-amino-4-deoxy-L-arabinose transferase-like glycosyltransferase
VSRPWLAAAALLVLVALAARIAFISIAPVQELTRDAADYDRHARSIAAGDGYPQAAAPGRPTAYRPPGYPYFLGAVYRLAGVRGADVGDRIQAARVAQALLGALAVALTGALAWRLWGRRVALLALALAAVYVPAVVVGGTILSEQLFVVFVLAALLVALWQRESRHAVRLAALAGVFAGLAGLTRSNGLVVVVPLALLVWRSPPRLAWRSATPAAVLVLAAVLTVAPWTIRNAVVLDSFVPVATQTGAALAGTYNDAAREDPRNPGAWRVLRLVPDYQPIYRSKAQTSEAVLDRRLRAAALHYIAEHPFYVAEVGFWNTLRMVDLAGRERSRRSAEAIGVEAGWADASAIAFWAMGLLAVAGALTPRARRVPWQVWAVPAVLFLSVVFLNVESPRFRAPIDPFVVMLAAVAVVAALERRSHRRPGVPTGA